MIKSILGLEGGGFDVVLQEGAIRKMRDRVDADRILYIVGRCCSKIRSLGK